jgi:hypothetical protein
MLPNLAASEATPIHTEIPDLATWHQPPPVNACLQKLYRHIGLKFVSQPAENLRFGRLSSSEGKYSRPVNSSENKHNGKTGFQAKWLRPEERSLRGHILSAAPKVTKVSFSGSYGRLTSA